MVPKKPGLQQVRCSEVRHIIKKNDLTDAGNATTLTGPRS